MSNAACPRCATAIHPLANFCARCGLRVSPHMPADAASGAGEWWNEVISTGMRPPRCDVHPTHPLQMDARWPFGAGPPSIMPRRRLLHTAIFLLACVLPLIIAAGGLLARRRAITCQAMPAITQPLPPRPPAFGPARWEGP